MSTNDVVTEEAKSNDNTGCRRCPNNCCWLDNGGDIVEDDALFGFVVAVLDSDKED